MNLHARTPESIQKLNGQNLEIKHTVQKSTDKTIARIKTNNYFSDTPRTPYRSLPAGSLCVNVVFFTTTIKHEYFFFFIFI